MKDHGVIVADRKRQVAAGCLAPARAGRVPLPDLLAAWSQVRPRQEQERTCQCDQSAWTSHLAHRFGDRPVARITGRDVQAWVRRVRGEWSASAESDGTRSHAPIPTHSPRDPPPGGVTVCHPVPCRKRKPKCKPDLPQFWR